MFLQPDRMVHDRPARIGATFEEARFQSADGTELTGAWFASRRGAPKGTIVHFHGNGENMTSHYLFVYWLALEGYDVFVFDYRGYGASGGSKSIPGAVADGVAALRYARGRAKAPVVVVGQSLGGALAVAALAQDGGRDVAALVLDSTFASYRGVARDKLAGVWLTWPLHWPLGFLISDRYAPERLIAQRPPMPLLMLHAKDDPVVPYAQGKRLYDAASGPKELWTLDSAGHTEAMFARGAEYRPKLLAWLAAALKR